ncbi:hypothetical protein ADU59_10915 [Pararhizobium polonicum]|uniref:Uncharacterized protein n=1 Tax=Pararhizobium polonicum TaxID=1612624 RepID=A0A1C7P3Q8_9HYPH|nr:hypothetical protein ADU59_10915 [Pararhizobium polonicum]
MAQNGPIQRNAERLDILDRRRMPIRTMKLPVFEVRNRICQAFRRSQLRLRRDEIRPTRIRVRECLFEGECRPAELRESSETVGAPMPGAAII